MYSQNTSNKKSTLSNARQLIGQLPIASINSVLSVDNLTLDAAVEFLTKVVSLSKRINIRDKDKGIIVTLDEDIIVTSDEDIIVTSDEDNKISQFNRDYGLIIGYARTTENSEKSKNTNEFDTLMGKYKDAHYKLNCLFRRCVTENPNEPTLEPFINTKSEIEPKINKNELNNPDHILGPSWEEILQTTALNKNTFPT